LIGQINRLSADRHLILGDATLEETESSRVDEPGKRSQGWYFFLFPAVPRDFPCRRGFRSLLRAVHIFTAGTLLAGHIFEQPNDTLEIWLIAAIVSGLLILATDMHASMAVLFELRGGLVLIKMAALSLVLVFPNSAVPLLFLALLIGVVGSHMPKRHRHRALLLNQTINPDYRNG
jgi:hypothetical protein